jgi:hypothetical protein
MRAIRLLTVAAGLLAGCGSGEKAAGAGANQAAAPPGRASAAAPAAPEPQPAGEGGIPTAFHGLYDSSQQACGRPGDGRLAITARELRFHESVGSVREVASESADLIRVDADYQGEGQTWRNSHELRLSMGGARLTISGEGTSFVRVRCSEGGR